MISVLLARSLRDAGVRWTPADGDRFVVDGLVGLDGPDDAQVFTVSDMTIEEHRYETGSVLGFNGTTEWALDSVALEDALWLPSESQLRGLLGATFRSLERTPGGYRVMTVVAGVAREHAATDAADAYGAALLDLVVAATA